MESHSVLHRFISSWRLINSRYFYCLDYSYATIANKQSLCNKSRLLTLIALNVCRCLFQKSVSIERSVWLFSTNTNKFVRVKGSHVDALGLKTDESGELLKSLYFVLT